MSYYTGIKCDKCGLKNPNPSDATWKRVFGAYNGSPIVDGRSLPPNQPLPTGSVKPVALDFCPKCQAGLSVEDVVKLTESQNPTRPASPANATSPATAPAPTIPNPA